MRMRKTIGRLGTRSGEELLVIAVLGTRQERQNVRRELDRRLQVDSVNGVERGHVGRGHREASAA